MAHLASRGVRRDKFARRLRDARRDMCPPPTRKAVVGSGPNTEQVTPQVTVLRAHGNLEKPAVPLQVAVISAAAPLKPDVSSNETRALHVTLMDAKDLCW